MGPGRRGRGPRGAGLGVRFPFSTGRPSPRPQPHALSPLLFVDFWAQRFVGVDTYINRYIKTYGYIFLSFLPRSCMGRTLACLPAAHGFARQTGSVGTKRNAFCSPPVTVADSEGGNFSVKRNKPVKESGGNVCVLLNLFLRNCTFYCKKNKKDYLTHFVILRRI